MQALYAYHQSDNKAVQAHEKTLLQSIDKVFEMYVWMLALMNDVAQYAYVDAEERANRFVKSNREEAGNLKITENLFLKQVTGHEDYQAAVKKYRADWSVDPELPRALFATLKAAPEYAAYLSAEKDHFVPERDISKFIFKKVILKSTLADQAFEERFINWQVDEEVLQAMMAKTFKNFADSEGSNVKLADISANWAEDREFITELFEATIRNDKDFQGLITGKTQNWEAERIAMMDTLLMKMALAEFMAFSSIPVKVTINEYLEIAKEFSTPKSNSFINGILDKILSDLKAEGKIRKSGRGLVE